MDCAKSEVYFYCQIYKNNRIFKKAICQISILNQKIDDGNVRLQRLSTDENTTFEKYLKRKLINIEKVRDMFVHFVETKAAIVDDLCHMLMENYGEEYNFRDENSNFEHVDVTEFFNTISL